MEEVKIEVKDDEKKITVEEILSLSAELRKADQKLIDKYVDENKNELSKIREQFIKEFKDVPNDDKIKKLLIEDLKLLSISI